MNIEEAKKIVDKLSVDSDELWKIPMIPAHKVKALLDTLDQPKPEVPQMIFDVIKSFDDDVDYLHQHMSRQSDEVREWLTHNEREFYEAWLAYPNAAKSVTYLSKNSDGKAEVANKEIEKVTNLVNYYDKKQT